MSNYYKALVDHVSLFTNSRLVMMEMPLEGDEGRHSARRPPDMPQTLARLPAFTTFPPCQFHHPPLHLPSRLGLLSRHPCKDVKGSAVSSLH